MAKSTKKPVKPVRKRTTKADVERVTSQAAQEAVEEFEQEIEEEEEFEDPVVSFEPNEQASPLDVFEEAFTRAQKLNDVPRYHIKKNSQFLCVRDYPYSWEKLQAEFGEGYYQITAKRRSNGQLLKQQTEMVGNPNEGREVETEEQENSPSDNLALLGFLQQSQERAETRAREQAKVGESNLATIMQSVMLAQQESTKTMMTMMMEQSRQSQTLMTTLLTLNQKPQGTDPVITLLTTLLTKDKPKEGMGLVEVLKLLGDKERDTRQAVEKQYEVIERKSEALAEIKAEAMSGGGEEGSSDSLTQTLLKTFAPVLQQVMANQPGGQPGQLPPPGFDPRSPGNALSEGFIEETRPAIAAPANRSGNPRAMHEVGGGAAQPDRNRRPNPVRTQNPRPVQAAPTQPDPRTVNQVQNPPPAAAQPAPLPKDFVLDARTKEHIMNFLAGDIASAMVGGVDASTTSEVVLKKLETEGIPRHTVVNSFTLDDFYIFAEKNLPAEHLEAAKKWLKEFHESIVKAKLATDAPTANAVVDTTPIEANGAGHGSNGTNGQGPVAPRRGPAPRRTGTPPRQPAKTV